MIRFIGKSHTRPLSQSLERVCEARLSFSDLQAPGKPHRLLFARIFPFVKCLLVGRLDLASLIEGHRGVFGPHSGKAMVVVVDAIR